MEVQAYEFRGARYETFLGWYARQDDRNKIIGYQNSMFDAKLFQAVDESSSTANVGEREIAIRSIALRNQNGYHAIWYWYRIDGRDLASAVIVKLLQAKRRLLFQDGSATLYAVASAPASTPAAAEAGLRSFLAASSLPR